MTVESHSVEPRSTTPRSAAQHRVESSSKQGNKTLPPAPRVDHLKRQAKDLFKAHQGGDVQAAHRIAQWLPRLQHLTRVARLDPQTVLAMPLKLSDAQLVIAREYGFSSWPKLKAHVEHLRQPDEAIIKQFCSAVNERASDRLHHLLQEHPELRSVIDDPLFDFDAPAIVQCKTDRATAEVLLEFGADINARSRWWAGSFGVLDDVTPEQGQYLMERGAAIDVHAAANLGLLDHLQKLLAADPELVNARGGDGMRPLHFARSREVIDFLLDHGADVDARDIDHNGTPAQHAVRQPEKLRHLLQRGATPDIFMACVLGDIELAQRLLEADPAALEARIGQGQFTAPGGHIYLYALSYTARPLDLAAQHGHTGFVDYLLPRSNPQQRFLFACLRADEAMAQAELAKQPNLVQSLASEDRSAICDAAWRNDAAAVGVMLRVGFDVNTRGIHDSTPLDRAALWGYREVVELCVAYGADLSVLNEFGGTPLGACLHGSMQFRNEASQHAACVEMLLQAGAVPSDTVSGSQECIEILRLHGVSS